MSKRKREETDEIETLQKEIRELKALNRSLVKQIKKLSKGANRIQELEEILQDEFENKSKESPKETKKAGYCPKCVEGELSLVSLGEKAYSFCSHCSYRKRTKA